MLNDQFQYFLNIFGVFKFKFLFDLIDCSNCFPVCEITLFRLMLEIYFNFDRYFFYSLFLDISAYNFSPIFYRSETLLIPSPSFLIFCYFIFLLSISFQLDNYLALRYFFQFFLDNFYSFSFDWGLSLIFCC